MPGQYVNLAVGRRTGVLIALLLAVAGIWASAAVDQAKAAAFSESANLHKISKNGASFVERGPATGTYAGSLTLYLTTTPNGVRFRMRGVNASGSLVGAGAASITSHGKIGIVDGKASFTGGTGKFDGADGSGLSITGKFNRETYALQVTISGDLDF